MGQVYFNTASAIFKRQKWLSSKTDEYIEKIRIMQNL